MKVKIGKQEAAYQAVKKHRESNPEVSLKDAIAAVASQSKSTTHSVQAAYYTHARRNGDALAPRRKATATKTAPKKVKTTTKKKIKQSNGSMDLNLVRTSLMNALDTIKRLEDQNAKNERIITEFRRALSHV